jgi:hypothetical protein
LASRGYTIYLPQIEITFSACRKSGASSIFQRRDTWQDDCHVPVEGFPPARRVILSNPFTQVNLMNAPPYVLTHAIDQARAQWLAGDPGAWARYATCLMRLEAEIQQSRHPRPMLTGRRRTSRRRAELRFEKLI